MSTIFWGENPKITASGGREIFAFSASKDARTAQRAGRKNIKIANKSLFSFDFFAPFNFYF